MCLQSAYQRNTTSRSAVRVCRAAASRVIPAAECRRRHATCSYGNSSTRRGRAAAGLTKPESLKTRLRAWSGPPFPSRHSTRPWTAAAPTFLDTAGSSACIGSPTGCRATACASAERARERPSGCRNPSSAARDGGHHRPSDAMRGSPSLPRAA